jgi:hypothetical protein
MKYSLTLSLLRTVERVCNLPIAFWAQIGRWLAHGLVSASIANGASEHGTP